MALASRSPHLLVRAAVAVLRLMSGPDGRLQKLVNVGSDTVDAISGLLCVRWDWRLEAMAPTLRIRSVQELLNSFASILLLDFACLGFLTRRSTRSILHLIRDLNLSVFVQI